MKNMSYVENQLSLRTQERGKGVLLEFQEKEKRRGVPPLVPLAPRRLKKTANAGKELRKAWSARSAKRKSVKGPTNADTIRGKKWMNS